jgi:hypothetical protein
MIVESVIKPPIIVVCDVVYVFDTLDKAESYIEPWDADDCTGYDSEGRLLRLLGMKHWEQTKARTRPATFRDKLALFLKGAGETPPWTRIVLVEADPTHALEAADAIRNRLIGLNEPWGKKWPGLGLSPEWIGAASLQELIQFVRDRGGDL